MVETDNKFFIVETKIIDNIDTYQLRLFSKIERKSIFKNFKLCWGCFIS